MHSRKERFQFNAAVYVFLMSETKVLLMRRCNTGFEDGRFGVISGHVDGNETIVQAAVREAREECALELAARDLILATAMHRKVSDGEWFDWFFFCRDWNGSALNAEPGKCSELLWSDVEALPPDTVRYVRHALETALNSRAGRLRARQDGRDPVKARQGLWSASDRGGLGLGTRAGCVQGHVAVQHGPEARTLALREVRVQNGAERASS